MRKAFLISMTGKISALFFTVAIGIYCLFEKKTENREIRFSGFYFSFFFFPNWGPAQGLAPRRGGAGR
jgi:hypothetical protein